MSRTGARLASIAAKSASSEATLETNEAQSARLVSTAVSFASTTVNLASTAANSALVGARLERSQENLGGNQARPGTRATSSEIWNVFLASGLRARIHNLLWSMGPLMERSGVRWESSGENPMNCKSRIMG
jgi:hypothetical protein